MKRGRMEGAGHTFLSFGADLDDWPQVEALTASPDAEHAILLEEVRIGCTLGMLRCLDRPAHRRRLSRARRSIVDFMKDKCGLVNPKNPCRCSRRLPIAVARGRVDASHLLHAGRGPTARAFPETLRTIRALEEARRAVALYRAQSEPRAPATLTDLVRTIVDEPGRA